MKSSLLQVPASYFGIVLGLVGLGACWRTAARMGVVPAGISQTFNWLAIAVYLALTVSYVAKWIWNRKRAIEEFEHPVQCCFVGLVPISAMLIALNLMPHSRLLALALGSAGATIQLMFAAYRTGLLWKGGRDHAATTPVLYLPTVAGNLVTSNLASAYEAPDIAAMFFGAGMLSWFAIESVLLHRLYMERPLDLALRPTLGIQIAPAFVACSAYLSLTSGVPDLMAKGLLGYGILQVLIVAGLLPWIVGQPFVAGYWAFSFGLTAAAYDALEFVERGASGLFPVLAVALFCAMNVVMFLIVAGTIRLALKGELLPKPTVV